MRFDGTDSVQISIHALHEESDHHHTNQPISKVISIHALHEESDLSRPSMTCSDSIFQSTLSMRRATAMSNFTYWKLHISIHALHEESDLPSRFACTQHGDFNPRSP